MYGKIILLYYNLLYVEALLMYVFAKSFYV